MEPQRPGPGRLESGMKGNSASSLLSKPRVPWVSVHIPTPREMLLKSFSAQERTSPEDASSPSTGLCGDSRPHRDQDVPQRHRPSCQCSREIAVTHTGQENRTGAIGEARTRERWREKVRGWPYSRAGG
ncbi:uncharacterized protein LOC117710448 isoform X2 [Arvicanthis niloticus]|uniref:uncharacterized protein LOC117710448 isoform X2 n=1 Tax=Arvicanthis niloticus TaxID=61156 RepID=UPI00402B1FC3